MQVDDQIREHLAAIDGDVVLSVEAERLVRSFDMDELSDWLHSNAQLFVHERMRLHLKSTRARARSRRGSRRFAEAAESTPLLLEQMYCIDDEFVWRPLKDMDKRDLLYAARDMTELGNRSLLEAAFLHALARKVGNKKVGQVLSEEQLLRLRAPLESKKAA